jgi:hypothetical protein
MQRKARIEALRIHQSRIQRKQALQEKGYRKAVQENVRTMESSSSGDSSSSEEDCEEQTGAGSKRSRVTTPNRRIKKKKQRKTIRSSKNLPTVAAFGGKTRYKMHMPFINTLALGLKYVTCHAPFKHAMVFAIAISLRIRSFRCARNKPRDYRRKLEANPRAKFAAVALAKTLIGSKIEVLEKYETHRVQQQKQLWYNTMAHYVINKRALCAVNAQEKLKQILNRHCVPFLASRGACNSQCAKRQKPLLSM